MGYSCYPTSKSIRQRRKLTEKEMAMIEGWAAIRVPLHQMADLLDMSLRQLQENINKSDDLRRVIAQGRAKGSVTPRRTLYERAIGRKAYIDENGVHHPEIPVEFPALKLWLCTQEGFSLTEKVEVSGPDGGPIENTNVTKEELKARLATLRKQNDLSEDE